MASAHGAQEQADDVTDAVAAQEAAAGMMQCAYEIAREKRIRENHAELVRLGLATAKEGFASSSKAKAKAKAKAATSKKKKKTSVRKKRSAAAAAAAAGPVRKSRRIAGQGPSGGAQALGDDFSAISAPDSPYERENEKKREAEYEDARRAKYKRLLDKHTNAGQDLPPRATYEHTVHRCLSMSPKALANRIKAIERSAGIYAVVKMRMFAECLLIEGYEELSDLAQAALTRLLALPRFKGTARHCRRVYKQATKDTKKRKK
jgi:hypothetical protein